MLKSAPRPAISAISSPIPTRRPKAGFRPDRGPLQAVLRRPTSHCGAQGVPPCQRPAVGRSRLQNRPIFHPSRGLYTLGAVVVWLRKAKSRQHSKNLGVVGSRSLLYHGGQSLVYRPHGESGGWVFQHPPPFFIACARHLRYYTNPRINHGQICRRARTIQRRESRGGRTGVSLRGGRVALGAGVLAASVLMNNGLTCIVQARFWKGVALLRQGNPCSLCNGFFGMPFTCCYVQTL